MAEKQQTKEEKVAQYLDEVNQLMQLETANAMQSMGPLGQFIQLEVARAKLVFIGQVQQEVANIMGADSATKKETS